MSKNIRHIWAKAEQHVKVHRRRAVRNRVYPHRIDIEPDALNFAGIVMIMLCWLFKWMGYWARENSRLYLGIGQHRSAHNNP